MRLSGLQTGEPYMASVAMRRIRSQEVILILADLMIEHGCPTHVR